jgi:hypothetical protein
MRLGKGVIPSMDAIVVLEKLRALSEWRRNLPEGTPIREVWTKEDELKAQLPEGTYLHFDQGMKMYGVFPAMALSGPE